MVERCRGVESDIVGCVPGGEYRVLAIHRQVGESLTAARASGMRTTLLIAVSHRVDVQV